MYAEDDYIQLSSLQHYVFCPRQCGLIHVHGIWEENRLTAKGRVMHERVDSGEEETRGDVHVTRSLAIYSKKYALSGRADVVEFRDERGGIVPYPVEYKSGKPKLDLSDSVQLCAQALCLEEMTGSEIRTAAFFYGKTRHRHEVVLDAVIRLETEKVISAVHALIHSRLVPDAEYNKKCRSCSLADQCMPFLGRRKISGYVKELFDYETAS